jgi:parallel beta-helix repeat protein
MMNLITGRKFIAYTIFTFLLITIAPSINAFNPISIGNPEILTINYDFDIVIPDDFSTIQDGINNANPGEKIFVRSGIYYESIIIDKEELLIQGENKFTTIIDLENRNDDAVYIEGDNVIFKEFTVTNARHKTKRTWHQSGIEIISSNVTIQGCIIMDNRLGILSHTIAYNLTIQDNMFFHDGYFPGCYLPYSDYVPIESIDNTVINNTINGKPLYYIKNEKDIVVNEDAGQVVLVNCSNVTVRNLYLKDIDFSVSLYYSSNCTIENTTILDADGELILLYSENNTIQNNKILNSYLGICIDIGSKNNIVRNNEIIGCIEGMSILSSCTGNRIYKNKLKNAEWGMKITSFNQNMPSYDNYVYDNDFIGNNNGIVITNSLDNPMYYTYNNTISNNSFYKNRIGLYIKSSESNIIKNNIFNGNLISALFKGCKKNYWCHNYWNRPRILPKIIFGTRKIGLISIPWINMDWNPIKRFQ